MKKLLIIALFFGFILALVTASYAQDIEKDELRLQLLETEITALRTAVQRDNAQIGFLQERIARLNLEVEKRLQELNQLRADIQKEKDKEKPKEK